MIDLHVHSTHSDGSLTPAELVARAIEAGLTAVALTDHDTTGGVGEFLAAGAAPGADGLTCLSGVELSAEVVEGTLHVLGYGVRPGAPELEDALRGLRGGREVRNREILARLNAMGIALEWSGST